MNRFELMMCLFCLCLLFFVSRSFRSSRSFYSAIRVMFVVLCCVFDFFVFCVCVCLM